MGTRMKSSLPKVMHTVLGRPMLDFPIRRAIEAGAEHVAVVVGHGREVVEAWLAEAWPDAPISTHVQTQMLGTADAVRAALPAFEDFDGNVLILYGDVPNLGADVVREIVARQSASTAPLTLLTAHDLQEHQYGRIVRDATDRPERIVEFKDATPAQLDLSEVNIGVYAVDAKFLVWALSNTQSNNAQREFYLTDMVWLAHGAGTPAEAVVAASIDPLHGVNNRAQLAEANALARTARNRELMLSGVTMLDPASTWVDLDSTVGVDVFIEPGVTLRGQCVVGEGTYLEAGVRLENSRVGARERIGR
jgi:bifunctional UDP-N-acetylglucosamine pyrophosphorylase/glucosamine-1-phosphate N-acetyltransferase